MKAHCIFCGKDFIDIDSFENHLLNHKELKTHDRNIYLKETQREIQNPVEVANRKKEAKLHRDLLKTKKSNKPKNSRKIYFDSTTCSIRAILIASGNKQ
jgi:hypothetical protein